MPMARLTQQFIDTELRCPPGKRRVELCDTAQPGLYVEVRETAPGEGTYYLRSKVAGKTRHEKLGRTGEISLADARRKAKQLKAGAPAQVAPATEAAAGGKGAMTYAEFFEGHYMPYVKPRKRSWRRDEELYRLRVKGAFGAKKLSEITRQQAQTFHAGVLAQGLSPASADHHLKLLRQSLNLALAWEMLAKNPLAGVKLFLVDNRVEHLLDDAQLQGLLQVLRTDRNRAVCRIALFLLSTGCRLGEALRATWGQVDRTNRVWRIPATSSKSKRTRSVPLNDSALEVLAEVGTEGRYEFIFINRRTGKPYRGVMKVWSRLRRKAGVPWLRLHDLRHGYASFLVNAGRSLYEVQQILGHSNPVVTQRYAHLSSRALQDAASSASAAIKGATQDVAP
jgi:integrase